MANEELARILDFIYKTLNIPYGTEFINNNLLLNAS